MDNLIGTFVDSFLELLYPEKNICQICGTYDTSIGDCYICNNCLSKLEKINEPFCKICNKSLAHNPNLEICEECIKSPRSFEISKSPYRYKGSVKKLIHDYKYCNKPFYYKLFGNLLVQYMKENSYIYFDYIISVPLHKIKLRKRGFNQSKLIAKYIQKNLSIPYIDALKRVNNTEKQSNLSKYNRQNNLKNAFIIKNKKVASFIKDKNILIIDDIFTTGATINECSKVLKSSGANKIYALTISR